MLSLTKQTVSDQIVVLSSN